METDRHQVGLAVGKIPSGCSVLTVEHKGRAAGMLVSWVQQASFEPLAVSVCVKRGRPIAGLIAESQKFVLNVVGDAPSAMLRHFARGFSPAEDAFAGLQTERSEFGPVIMDCIAHLSCRLLQTVEAGDHDLYLAEVMAGQAAKSEKPYVHLRHSGLVY